jgi:hypothetical protein
LFVDGINVQTDVLLLPAKVALAASAEINTFTLADIRLCVCCFFSPSYPLYAYARWHIRHDNIEHDTSLSRGDSLNGTGDNFTFNSTIFSTLANSNPGVDYYNGTSAGTVLKERLAINRIENPLLKNTRKEFAIRIRESALYIGVMGNVTSGVAPKKCVMVGSSCAVSMPDPSVMYRFVNIFFQEERLPIEEGWTRSSIPIDSASMKTVNTEIIQAAQWTPDAGVCATITFVETGNLTFVV